MWIDLRRMAVGVVAALGLSGCSTVSYYAHVVHGGWQVLEARQPIDTVLADPAQDEALKARLRSLQAARRFAVTGLALPDNGSYTRYADVHRPYVVWNVFAAPELSLMPVEHCFPVAGCVAYRGYYDLGLAKAEAARLKEQGYETFVGGVSAYSTLGWFDDPVLSTMLRWDDERLAATVFHELAHQRVYVKDDTAFNESYAKFVELEGLRQWRLARGLDGALPADIRFEEVFIARVMKTREELARLYAGPLDVAAKRAAKAAAFEALHRDYQRLKTEWQADDGYDGFFATPLNNAKLLPFGLYHQWLPAFTALFEQVHRDWPAFQARVSDLGRLPAVQRHQTLQQLMPSDAPSF